MTCIEQAEKNLYAHVLQPVLNAWKLLLMTATNLISSEKLLTLQQITRRCRVQKRLPKQVKEIQSTSTCICVDFYLSIQLAFFHTFRWTERHHKWRSRTSNVGKEKKAKKNCMLELLETFFFCSHVGAFLPLLKIFIHGDVFVVSASSIGFDAHPWKLQFGMLLMLRWEWHAKC